MKIKNKILILLVLISISTYGFASSRSHTFKSYLNDVFVETGTYMGHGVQFALDAGFQQVYSIELSPKYYTFCTEKFKHNTNVKIHYGDSADLLYEIIKDINTPITFWLDGHCSFGDTARGSEMTPVLKELEQIKMHPIRTHTILIDDVREFGTYNFDFIPLDEIIKKIYEINPNYTIHFEDGIIPNDILVATIEDND